ncbi:sulfotransferase [Acuticoccus sediminis]|nr:sulfotransferase [Acuticoccus sediminis]
MTSDPRTRPIFILGRPSSRTALASAMIGGNPDTFAVPDINLFAEDRLELVWSEMARLGQAHADGLVRTVACLYAGDQSIASVQMARRWVLRRYFWPIYKVFEELADKVAPRRLVDRSRVYSVRKGAIERILESYPDAQFVHLVSHPAHAGTNPFARRPKPKDDAAKLAADDWLETNRRLCNSLANVDEANRVLVRLEDLLGTPEGELARISRAFGLRSDPAAIEAMMHPERSPFATVGPAGAPFGDDRAFLKDPVLRTADAPRPDVPVDASLPDEISELAAQFGYRTEAALYGHY